MAEVLKVLAQGQLGTSVASIYTPGSGITGIILTCEFLNVSGSTVTMDLYVNGTAAANQIKSGVTLLAGESLVFDGKITLANANTDSFQGKASAATSVTYTVMGVAIG